MWIQINKAKGILNKALWGQGSSGFELYSGCFKCGLPQDICEQWVAVEGDEGRHFKVPGKECQYKGLAIKVVAAVLTMQEKEAEEAIRDAMEKKGIITKEVEIIRLLGKMVQWGGLKTNWLTRAYYICCMVAKNW